MSNDNNRDEIGITRLIHHLFARRMDEQQRRFAITQHPVGDTAERPTSDTRLAICGHHHEVMRVVPRTFDDRRGGIMPADRLDADYAFATAQVIHEPLAEGVEVVLTQLAAGFSVAWVSHTQQCHLAQDASGEQRHDREEWLLSQRRAIERDNRPGEVIILPRFCERAQEQHWRSPRAHHAVGDAAKRESGKAGAAVRRHHDQRAMKFADDIEQS